jgi:hypothetical protein
MRVVVMGSRLPDFRTLQRLLLIADEVGFVDRPSVMFGEPGTEGQWGTIGRASEIRQFKVEDDAPVTLSAHEPPSGPAQALYEPYVVADLRNPRFLEAVFNGLRDDDFAWRFIQPQAQHGEGRVLGTELRQDLLTDATLPSQDLTDQSVKPMFTGKFGSIEHRRALFKNVAIEASITITSTLAVAAETGLQPVTEEPRFAQLLGMRAADHVYVGESPPHAGPLAIAVANALVPDETLSHLTVGDIFDYRRQTKEAHAAWSAEIDRLAVKIADMDPTTVERVLPQVIHGEFKPRILEYRNELKSVRDKMFGELIKKVATWNVPSISLAYLAGLSIPSAVALFAGTLAPAIPAVVDYYVARRALQRKNSAAYLVGLMRDD